MSGEDAVAWRERNQRHLVACTQRVRRCLERAIAAPRGEAAPSQEETESPAPGEGAPLAIESIQRA
ncbi:MAG TPA: hypothetical protein VIF09_03970, partial [Polyangiaceae bacterium]